MKKQQRVLGTTAASKSFGKISISAFCLLLVVCFVQHEAQAQQFIPHLWQRDSLSYTRDPWIRDIGPTDHVDDFIKRGSIVDIVVALNRFVPRDTLRSIYPRFIRVKADSAKFYIDDFVSFLFIPSVSGDAVFDTIRTRPEVYMVEYAGVFKSDLDKTIQSMAVRGLEYSPNTVDEMFPNPSTGLPLKGNGIGIIMMDSGVDDDGHQALVSPRMEWVGDFTVPATDSRRTMNPAPSSTHATVMAATAFGRGTESAHNYRGVAYCGDPGSAIPEEQGAPWGDIKIFDRFVEGQGFTGTGRFNYAAEALDHIITLKQTYPSIKIVNMSFSQYRVDDLSGDLIAPLPDDGTESFSQLVNYAVEQGLVCIASVGNNPSMGSGSITAPGSAFKAITVAASKTANSPNRNNHLVSNLSIPGPLNFTTPPNPEPSKYRWKPDITAPGLHHDPPPMPTGPTLPGKTPPGMFYTETMFAGTSIAAAHVSGLAALMLEFTNLSPACLKNALMQRADLHANRYTPFEDARTQSNIIWNQLVGTGFVDAYAAFSYLKKADLEITSPRWSTSNPPIPGRPAIFEATVRNHGPNDADSIHIDFGVNRFGIYPDSPRASAFSHEVTKPILFLRSGDWEIISIPFTPMLSSHGAPPHGDIWITNVKAEIRYGGDMNPANNVATLALRVIGTVALTKSDANSASQQNRNTQDVVFEIFNPTKTTVNVTLAVSTPPGVSVSFTPGTRTLTLPTVQNPPLQVVATINYPVRASGNIEIKATDSHSNPYGRLIIRLDPTVSVAEPEYAPVKFVLQDNFPNPFASETKIGFSILGQKEIVLEIYNVLGQRVKTLLNRKLPAGKQTALWDGTDDSGKRVAPGIYFYKLRSEKFVQSKKMVLLH